jgi:predicted Mrr-cat superfamily restriction endonuclease
MVNIWKIGSWPGLWDSHTLKTKEKYIKEYALPKNFVALGYGWIPNIKKTSKKVIKKLLENENCGLIERRTKELLSFANVIDKGDVILLYNYYKVYVGIVKNKNPYYHVKKGSALDFIIGAEGEDIAPHRIDVEWQFNKMPFEADFSKWQDTVHQVLEDDLDKIEDEKLRRFLRQKIHVNR